MSMFKAKNKKPFIGDNRVTLDAKHNEMLKYFKQLKNSLPEKRKNLTNFTNQYDELKKIPNKNLTSEQLNLKFSLADSINILKKEIDSIENSDRINIFYKPAIYFATIMAIWNQLMINLSRQKLFQPKIQL